MKIYRHVAVGFLGLIVFPSIAGAATISLGTASTYAVLGASTVTNTGNSVLTGDLGVSPGTSITGFPPGIVGGGIHINDPSAFAAQADALQAYNDLGALAVTADLSGQDLSQTLTAGVYSFSSSGGLLNTLTLDGPGTFVFLIGSDFTTSSASRVSLINGADVADIFFRVGASATFGTTSMFAGTVIANTSVTATTDAVFEGRLIALNGAVTLDSNFIAVPEPSSAVLLVPGLLMLFKRRRA